MLKKLIEAKRSKESDVPLLIIIDEVHQFYNGSDSKDALEDLSTICRTGRSMKIGVIFASQNPSDMPPGIPAVVNTKIYFKTESQGIKDIGSKITVDEMESLQTGYAIASIYDLPQLKVLKFPLSFAGVVHD
ncbi:helicase HerA-like domain-containing protein [Methanomethylophilus alvi]|uniref:helicase HerA-like domain-containing protein n=1 Tax=Methanomethylophilus alvi TaxID=1291540 RepID=UPI0037DD4D86